MQSTGIAGNGRGGAILSSGLVLLIAAGFLAYGAAMRHGPAERGLVLHAAFNSANGLKPGANVDLAGVQVGRVLGITLDPRTQMADVAFSVDRRLHLPVDTAVGIGAPTMTADNALQIAPGKSAQVLENDGHITEARDQLSLEQQVSNYIFGGGKLGQ